MNQTIADGIVRSLDDEIVREGVIALLDQRWTHALTLMSAPGGYGKTRSLAQAVRSNLEDPVGLEFYARLRPGQRDPGQLVRVLLGAITGADEPTADVDVGADRIIDAVVALSPTKVVLIVDDVHAIAESAAIGVLRDLIRQLPTNAHLLLSGRTVPDLPLARLRAGDQVLEVTGADLVFDSDEIAALAARHDVDRDMLMDLAGWPALVRLVLVAGRAGPQEFLMQEIVHDLAPPVVAGLVVASIAGVASDELLTRCGAEVTAASLAASVPLVDLSPDGEARPHDLWSAVCADLVSPDELERLVAIIAPWHSERRRHDEAIELAATHCADALARSLLMEALDASDLRLHAGSTERWLELFGGADAIAADDAELRLLRGWHERLSHGPGHGDADVAAALELFRERGDALGEARAGVEHAFRGFLAGDPGPVIEAVERSPRLVKSGVTFLQPLGAMTNAIIAELEGDFDRALEQSMRAIRPDVRREFVELTLRHRATLCFLAGDGDAAVATAEELVEIAPNQPNELLLQLSRFANGDIDELVDRWADVRYFQTGNVREDYTFAVGSVFIDACLGIEPDLTSVRSTTWDRPRERVQLALCEWCAQILAGREHEANDELRAALRAVDVDDPLVQGEFRRFAVSVYVASPEVRSLLESMAELETLGPYHLERLRLGRILVALRTGDSVEWSGYLNPAHTVSSMSLPWSVEIASGLIEFDEHRGMELADALLAIAGARAHGWFRRVAQGDRPVAAGARRVLSLLPSPPEKPIELFTEGGVHLVRDGSPVQVSRLRVRQLIVMLALRESVDRDEAMTELWPDKDTDRARNNLRITLSHLRDVLEPDRKSGEPSYHLRQRGNEIALNRSEHLAIDVWDLRDGLDAGDAAGAAGDRAARHAALVPVAEKWQPPVLADGIDLDTVAGDVRAFRARLRDATVEVAEAFLTQGRYDDADRLGRKLLRQDRFDERAHAIVIAAGLDAGQVAQAHHAIDDCLAMLAELDVAPAAATRMLLRRARYPEDGSRRSA